MPVVTDIPVINRPEHAVEYLGDLLEKSGLIRQVCKYDEELLERYPAAQLLAAPFHKELYATHTWLVTIRVDIYIMHAKFTVKRSTRIKEDLELATQIVNLIETNGDNTGLSLGERVVAGWIESETPGVHPPRTNKDVFNVCTRLSWRGTQQVRFE